MKQRFAAVSRSCAHVKHLFCRVAYLRGEQRDQRFVIPGD
jgi:hypothetical protein